MNTYIIGGVERIINQVDTYDEYYGTNGMNADEIFANSRADRAYMKELQKVTVSKLVEFSGGNSVVLPMVKFVNSREFKAGSELEKARKMEEFYTQESIKLYV